MAPAQFMSLQSHSTVVSKYFVSNSNIQSGSFMQVLPGEEYWQYTASRLCRYRLREGDHYEKSPNGMVSIDKG